MSYILIITAQYSENYAAQDSNWNGISTAWKPKGGAYLEAKLDTYERMMLTTDDIEAIAKNLLETKSDNVTKYEFVTYDWRDDEVEDITKDFKIAMLSMANPV